MKIAIWIIAVVEIIRAVQNMIQLILTARNNSNRQMKRATDALIQSFEKTDREFFEQMKEQKK